MGPRHTEPARRPPAGLAGLKPEWSRLVQVPTTDGIGRSWHILDNQVDNARLTLLCVHGNPSWSYLWRNVLAHAPADIRVIAVDQLDMGFSERTGYLRRLATRVDDLCELTDELGLRGPVVTIAHDWGGPISLGWAQRHLEQLHGVVLLNTAVHQPAGSPAPGLIRTARSRGILRPLTVNTGGFITGALNMSFPRPTQAIRKGFHAPYKSSARREAIADFVEDIPLDPSHPTAAPLDAIAAGLEALVDTPALLLWGPSDKVFSDLYLHDLEQRLPHAQVHRFVGASHFVSEDADVVTPIFDWLASDQREAAPARSAVSEVGVSDAPPTEQPAIIEMGEDASHITFGELRSQVEAAAAGLNQHGVHAGSRVALMIPPSVELNIGLYACWRIGAIPVLIDAGLGPRGMSRALATANPNFLIGITKALAAAKVMRWPGTRFSVEPLTPKRRRVFAVVDDLQNLARCPADVPPLPAADDQAFLVFTSGATGPSKGVRYTFRQAQAGRNVLTDLYKITPDDRLVAAFAPFALYGPSMGITSVVPDMDVTAPGTLTATALGDAVVAGDATLVFASPAALANVVHTAHELTAAHHTAFGRVRLLLSAGAPIRPTLMRAARELFPNAEAHTPYGMTECIPVADISLTEIDAASGGDGVCVGRPVDGVSVQIRELDALGEPTGSLTTDAGVIGEVIVRATHARDGYERLWHTDHLASQPHGWHRTGDAGHLDDLGRLWIGGRIGDIVATDSGPVLPVKIEQRIEDLADVDLAAIVGVGPAGTQQLVAVVQVREPARWPTLADLDLQTRVRSTTDHDLAAVFVVPHLPVDRRHNSKIDRPRIAKWTAHALTGQRMRRL